MIPHARKKLSRILASEGLTRTAANRDRKGDTIVVDGMLDRLLKDLSRYGFEETGMTQNWGMSSVPPSAPASSRTVINRKKGITKRLFERLIPTVQKLGWSKLISSKGNYVTLENPLGHRVTLRRGLPRYQTGIAVSVYVPDDADR